MEYERLSYGETVNHLACAIENDRNAYEDCAATARALDGMDRATLVRYAAASFVAFEALYGYKVRNTFPWLVSDAEHLAAAWSRVVCECIPDAEEVA